MSKEDELKRVYESTLQEIAKHDIVLPALYRDVFYEKAKEYGKEDY